MTTDRGKSIQTTGAESSITLANGTLGVSGSAHGRYSLQTFSLAVAVTTKYYKMTGYYSTGSVYESWVVTGSPATSSATNPNTGHACVNCVVSSFWQI